MSTYSFPLQPEAKEEPLVTGNARLVVRWTYFGLVAGTAVTLLIGVLLIAFDNANGLRHLASTGWALLGFIAFALLFRFLLRQ